MSAHNRFNLSAIIAIVAIAFIIRFIYVAEALNSPFHTVLMFDSKTYWTLADDLLKHGPIYTRVYINGPLYVYFLAVAKTFLGQTIQGVMLIQATLGALTCYVVYLLGAELFDKRVGLTAAVISAVYGPMVFYSAVILTEPVLMLINIALVYILTKAYGGGESWMWFAAGSIMGLSAWGKPNILIMLPVLSVLLWLKPSKRKMRVEHIICLWLGVFVLMLPLTLRNIAAGSFAVASSSFGYSLYIGNNPQANGLFIPLNELIPSSGEALYVESDFKSAGFDDVLVKKATEYMAGDPVGWMRLMFRKAMFYINAYEIPDIENYNIQLSGTVLAYLIPSMAAIAPLGLLGMILSVRVVKSWPASAYIMAYGLSFILFFVKARFRITLMPVLMVFAAYALLELARMWRAQRMSVLKPAAALLVFTVLVNNQYYNASSLEDRGMLNPYNNLGRAYAQMGDVEKARDAYLEAIRYNPRHAESYNNLGELFNRLGEYDLAEGVLRKALKLNPSSAYAHNNLGTTLFYLGRVDESASEYSRALIINQYYFEAANNLGNAYMRLGRADSAIASYKRAVQINPSDATVRYNLAAAYIKAGATDKAMTELDEAARIDPDHASEYHGIVDQIQRP